MKEKERAKVEKLERDEEKTISKATIARMPLYLHFLQ